MRLLSRRRVVTAVLASALVVQTMSSIAPASAQGTATPWAGTDDKARGGLTFYDASGKVITGGRTDTAPFAAYVEGRAVPRPEVADTKATLTLFKPQETVNPGGWSQSFGLGASTNYPNTSAPAPVKSSTLPVNTGGSRDSSLDEAVDSLGPATSTNPAVVDVFEVRLNTSAPQQGVSANYDYADIKIDSANHTWTLVYTPGNGPVQAGEPGTFTPVAPARILDTRRPLGGSTPAANGTVSLQVAGQAGVPAGVSAVVLNVTVNAPAAPGYITVWADGTPRPAASNLNFLKGQTVPNLVVAPVGANGKVDFYNGSAGKTQILADVSGYFAGGEATAPGTFNSVAPARILDTRRPLGGSTPAANGTVSLQVAGQAGVPAGVTAVVLNVTVNAPVAPGYITVWADGTARPAASNLNFLKGQTVPNLVVAPVGANGKVDFYNGSAGKTQILADVSGYFVGGTASVPGAFAPVAPARILDTRRPLGGSTPAANGTVSLQVAGQAGVPAGVTAVVLNVTVNAPAAPGYITVWADGTARPAASNLNFLKGQTVPNLVVAPVGANGKVDFYNGSAGKTQILADVSGYIIGAAK